MLRLSTILFLLLTAAHSLGFAKIPVILDTDIGSDIDDTWALIQLLNSPELDTRLIVSATANTEYRARIVGKMLELAGKTDIDVGIGVMGGSANEFQLPWVKDYELSDYPGKVYEDGIDAMIRTIHASEIPVTLIVIGPCKNIKEALKRDPTIATKVNFIGMHGAIDVGYGGKSPAVPEYNVYGDKESFQAVLDADWLSMEITPLDTCGQTILQGELYQEIFTSEDPLIKALMENYAYWSERVTWMKADFMDTKSSTLFDCVAIKMAYDKSNLVYETMTIEMDSDGLTRRSKTGASVNVAMRWENEPEFFRHLTKRLLGEE